MAEGIARARDAFDRQAWGRAYADLSAAAATSPLEIDDLERLGCAAYLVGRNDESSEVWARASQECARAEEAVRAAGGGSVGSRAQARPASPLSELSAREREVLALMAEGLSGRAIGERLHISAHTAHRHVANIPTKLGVRARVS